MTLPKRSYELTKQLKTHSKLKQHFKSSPVEPVRRPPVLIMKLEDDIVRLRKLVYEFEVRLIALEKEGDRSQTQTKKSAKRSK